MRSTEQRAIISALMPYSEIYRCPLLEKLEFYDDEYYDDLMLPEYAEILKMSLFKYEQSEWQLGIYPPTWLVYCVYTSPKTPVEQGL
jgi:hypothetical protein